MGKRKESSFDLGRFLPARRSWSVNGMWERLSTQDGESSRSSSAGIIEIKGKILGINRVNAYYGVNC